MEFIVPSTFLLPLIWPYKCALPYMQFSLGIYINASHISFLTEQNVQATCVNDTVVEDNSVIEQTSWLPLFGVPKLIVYNSVNNSGPAVIVLNP